MKIRNDYVSNSSSSSFIISNNQIVDSFNLTKEDILNALIDDYGVEAYKKAQENYKKACYEYPEYNKKNIQYQDFGPFYIYDLEDEKNKAQAIDMWGDLLDDWDATNTTIENGKIYLGAEGRAYYNGLMSYIEKIYNVYDYNVKNALKTGELPTMFVRSETKDPETGMYGKDVPVPDYLYELFKHIRKDCGVMTNLEVIKSEVARFFFHAEDNEIWGCKSSQEHEKNDNHPDSEWESEFYSMDRISEIIFKWLVKNGRIKIDDEKFLESVNIPEDELSPWDKQRGHIYNLVNGKSLTWKDFNYFVMSAIMHEG